MALSPFATHAITIVEPGLITERGQEVEDWSSPTRRTITGCSVQPGAGARDMEHGDGVTADYTVYLPPEALVPARARVELPEQASGQFLIQGEPERWIFGATTDHIRIRLRRRDG
ncbi:hypothetical protein M3B43_07430 [Nesterenkonia massiliensis]|uniref:Head-to-tail stopper n=1 Tax=Nesterenkonia massiliensis TaxID=1232429 RepID=A0ABT2HRI9_9MICC|nr:hypothetical protein [Nesterenkonia massiliensis]MCT1607159.1 hypothetical protein [Nesterenkonia massiliensis]